MDVDTFLKEALLMKDFHHKNVMDLTGICLGIEQLPLVVLPFMRRGDVLSYIRDVNNVRDSLKSHSQIIEDTFEKNKLTHLLPVRNVRP